MYAEQPLETISSLTTDPMKSMEMYQIPVEWVSKWHGLIKPNYRYSNAAVLPEALRQLSISPPLSLSDRLENPALAKALQHNFPEGYNNILFLICDGLGVDHLKQYKSSIWENINPEKSTGGTVGCASFPTITTTNMTSISTGTAPGSHGFVGYNIYNEHLGTIFNGLNGRYVKNGEIHSVHDLLSNDAIVSMQPIPELLHQRDIPIFFLVPAQQEKEGLITFIAGDTPVIDYSTEDELVFQINQALNDPRPNKLIACYIGTADHLGHHFGPSSTQYQQAIQGIEQLLEHLLQHPVVQAGRTLILLTSDHGQVDIDHTISRYLTREQIQELAKTGIQLSTTGRVIHAYCEGVDLDDAREQLRALADGKALVLSQSEAIDLFGDNAGHFHQRIGDFVIVCQEGFVLDVPEVVTFEAYEGKLLGQHGSLTSKELFIPIGIWPVNEQKV